MTSQTLYIKPHPVWGQHIHITCDITAIIWVITSTVWTTSHPLFLWHHTFHMCSILCIIQDITSSLCDLKPPFWAHYTQYIRHHVHCISVISPTLSMISQPLYVWYHIQYMWDILSTMFMTSYPLCMTSQTCVLITPHSAYVWHHLCYRRHQIHSTKPSHNLYDFTTTSAMTSHSLYQTSQQLYLYHHNLSTDITPTFVWHHTHYMCDIICTIYNIISIAYVITLLYLGQHKLDIWNHIQYAVQNIHNPCDITVTSLCHHTHCIESITPSFVWYHTRHMYSIFCTIGDITSSIYEIKPPFLWHHTHYIWHCINAVSFITSTVLMISHQIYLWDLMLYICRHHIHCIVYNNTMFVPSQTLYLCLTPTLSMISHPLCIWHCTHYMFNIRYSI